MLQELRDTVADATKLVAEIGLRFKAGDPADELVLHLEAVLAGMFRQMAGMASEIPDDLRAQIAQLLNQVQIAVASGDEWLAQTGPELATLHLRQRLQRAYGVP